MKTQWAIIFVILFALLVAVFAVLNVEPVTINYFFGTAEWPLILVILGSVLMGGLIIGLVSFVKILQLKKQLKNARKDVSEERAHVKSEAEGDTTKK